jgi:DNA polymerase
MATDNNLKKHYLQAMGIQAWELKSATASFEAAQQSTQSRSKLQLAEPPVNSIAKVEPPVTESEATDSVLQQQKKQLIQPPQEEDNTENTDLEEKALENTDLEEKALEEPAVENPDLKKIVTAVNNCRQCSKRTDRLQALAGQGKQNNLDVFFITDPPVAEEDRAGVYLPEQEGVLFQAMLKSVALTNRCYVSGLLKCHSLELFVPTEEEIQQCFSFLSVQINILKPKVLVSFGRLAAQYLLHTKHCFNELINQLHTVNIEGNKYPLIVTHPPSFLLRNPHCKKQSLKDLIRIKQLVSEHMLSEHVLSEHIVSEHTE